MATIDSSGRYGKPKWLKSGYSDYESFNKVKGLPRNFRGMFNSKKSPDAGSVVLYYIERELAAVFSTQVGAAMGTGSLAGSYYPTPAFNTSEKRKMLLYVLENGIKSINPDSVSLEDIKDYISAQLAIWCIAEGIENNSRVLALVLGASNPLGSKSQFAPTPDVGAKAKLLLEAAVANKDTAPTNPLYPSFLCPTIGEANGNPLIYPPNNLALTDTNGVLGGDWRNGRINVSNASGAVIDVDANTHKMLIRVPKDAYQNFTATFESKVAGNIVEYFANNHQEEPVHEMARLVRQEGKKNKELYVAFSPKALHPDYGSITLSSKPLSEFGQTQQLSYTLTANSAIDSRIFLQPATQAATTGGSVLFEKLPLGFTYSIKGTTPDRSGKWVDSKCVIEGTDILLSQWNTTLDMGNRYKTVSVESSPPPPGNGTISVFKRIFPADITDINIKRQVNNLQLVGKSLSDPYIQFSYPYLENLELDSPVFFSGLPTGFAYSLVETGPTCAGDWVYIDTVIGGTTISVENWIMELTDEHPDAAIALETHYMRDSPQSDCSEYMDVFSSIALEELGLGNVLDAEGKKVQYVLGILQDSQLPFEEAVSARDVLDINQSVKEMVSQISVNQMLLLSKTRLAIEGYYRCLEMNLNTNNEFNKPPKPSKPTFQRAGRR
ncbi:MAG: thioester domain-containing protein [Eubacteriaceae bacterium]|nr:thioester domain-containing protein [Eubacteriaceae bacterium]